MNNTIKIVVESPLLRPGLRLETTVSEKYVVKATEFLMGIVREINSTQAK